jgi:hypothetical protein
VPTGTRPGRHLAVVIADRRPTTDGDRGSPPQYDGCLSHIRPSAVEGPCELSGGVRRASRRPGRHRQGRRADRQVASGGRAAPRHRRPHEARSWLLVHDGRRYDSKAIVGVAHGYATGRPLAAAEFTGGDATVGAALRRVGFVVQERLPRQDWRWDKLALACDLVHANGWDELTPVGAENPSVQFKRHVCTRGGCRRVGLVAGCRGGRVGRGR